MKRTITFISIFLMILMLAGLTACKEKTNGSDDSLLIVVREAGYGRWLDSFAIDFENETGTVVNVVYDAKIDDQSQYLFTSNDPSYDLYFCNNAAYLYTWQKNGYLYPITGIEDRIADYIKDYGVIDGNRYVVDPMTPTFGFAYNRTMLQSIPSKGAYTMGTFPTSWQGLLDLCDSVIENGVNGDKTVKPFSSGGSVEDADMIYKALWAQGNAGKDFADYLNTNVTIAEFESDSKKDVFVNDSIKNALIQMANLFNSNGIEPINAVHNSVSATNIESQQQFINGKCVFVVTGAWFPMEMSGSLKNSNIDYAFSNVPMMDESATKTALVNIPSEGFFIPAYSSVADKTPSPGREKAVEFINFLFREDNCEKLHVALNTPVSAKYTLSDENFAKLTEWGKDVYKVTSSSKIVIKGSSNKLFLVGGLGLFKDKGGNNPVNIFGQNHMYDTNKELFLSKIDTYMNDSYAGYKAKWNEIRNAAGYTD